MWCNTVSKPHWIPTGIEVLIKNQNPTIHDELHFVITFGYRVYCLCIVDHVLYRFRHLTQVILFDTCYVPRCQSQTFHALLPLPFVVCWPLRHQIPSKPRSKSVFQSQHQMLLPFQNISQLYFSSKKSLTNTIKVKKFVLWNIWFEEL